MAAPAHARSHLARRRPLRRRVALLPTLISACILWISVAFSPAPERMQER